LQFACSEDGLRGRVEAVCQSTPNAEVVSQQVLAATTRFLATAMAYGLQNDLRIEQPGFKASGSERGNTMEAFIVDKT
jgi:hypothetical protein